MQFGVWYQINCEGEEQWPDDFRRIADAGFDWVVLWSMALPDVAGNAGDLTGIVTGGEATQRALAEAARAGLATYLGIWHPHSMGRIRRAWQPQWSDGRAGAGPDIFNPGWLRYTWRPYVRQAGRLCAGQRACRGVFLDDTFPALPSLLHGYLGYAPADRRRFRQWLAARYGSVANLNMTHWLDPGFRSLAEVEPPAEPLQNLPLWSDWMLARDEWCQDFIATARHALDEAAPAERRLELVLSDHDLHMLCNGLQYGVDYSHLMPFVDRLETYMAPRHSAVTEAELVSNVRLMVRNGVRLAKGKPFLFHTWFADRETLQPMSPALLQRLIETAAEEGASGAEVYTFKVHDWRRAAGGERERQREPALRASSLKYNPELLDAITQTNRTLATSTG